MRNIQSGKINKSVFALITVAILFVAYFGFKKRNKIINEVSSITTKLTGARSSEPNYSGYGVQLMATRDLWQAEQLMNDFARDGYSAFVVEGFMRGKAIYKVRIGPYSHRPEALAIKDKLKRRYPRNHYVKKSIVIYRPKKN